MKTIGLIGGMSWESSADYYRLINAAVKRELGGLHSAKVILFSVDFHEIEALQAAGSWQEAGKILANSARALELAGADFVLLCTNTMHKVADYIKEAIHIPFLHIADATAGEIKKANIRTVGLLGTAFTMEQEFYKARLEDEFGLRVLIPDDGDRKIVHSVIYDELCKGVIRESSRKEYARIIKLLVESGSEAVILGCTEIGLLVGEQNASVPLFDTTKIHATQAVKLALAADMEALND